MRVKLDKVCKRIYAGGDVPKGRYSTVKTAEYAIPIYANAEKDNGLYGYTDTARENELSITVAARGTIGFTAIRREPFLPVVRLITVVPDLSTVSERYLYYALRNCKPAFSGTSIPQLTVPDIKKNEIELYSLSVQETIADKLDAVGRIIELRQQQLQKLDDLVKARFVEMFGDCKSMVSMNELCSIITDGTHQPPRFQESGIPFIFVSNLVGNVVTYNAEKFISEDTYAELYKRTPIEIGDLLLSTVGSYGHPAVVTEDRKFLFQRHIAYLKPRHNMVNSFYLHSALLAPDGQRQIEEKVKGIAQKTLNLSEIKKIVVPLPTIEEQNQFEKFVNQTDKSKVAVQKSLDEAQLLFDSLMQQYFG